LPLRPGRAAWRTCHRSWRVPCSSSSTSMFGSATGSQHRDRHPPAGRLDRFGPRWRRGIQLAGQAERNPMPLRTSCGAESRAPPASASVGRPFRRVRGTPSPTTSSSGSSRCIRRPPQGARSTSGGAPLASSNGGVLLRLRAEGQVSGPPCESGRSHHHDRARTTEGRSSQPA
jgi:hypothetical protein